MNVLIVLLVGLAAGLGTRSHHRHHHHAAINAVSRSPAAVAAARCKPKRDSVWVVNLKQPNVRKWIVQGGDTLCNPATGQRVTVHGLGLENH